MSIATGSGRAFFSALRDLLSQARGQRPGKQVLPGFEHVPRQRSTALTVGLRSKSIRYAAIPLDTGMIDFETVPMVLPPVVTMIGFRSKTFRRRQP